MRLAAPLLFYELQVPAIATLSTSCLLTILLLEFMALVLYKYIYGFVNLKNKNLIWTGIMYLLFYEDERILKMLLYGSQAGSNSHKVSYTCNPCLLCRSLGHLFFPQ